MTNGTSRVTWTATGRSWGRSLCPYRSLFDRNIMSEYWEGGEETYDRQEHRRSWWSSGVLWGCSSPKGYARKRTTHQAVGEGRGDAWWLLETDARRRRRPFSRMHEIGKGDVVGGLRSSGYKQITCGYADQQSGLNSNLVQRSTNTSHAS